MTVAERESGRVRTAPGDEARGGSGSSAAAFGPVERAFLVLASPRTTSVLVILLAAFVAITALVPQGREAVPLAEHPDATAIHALIRLGLTEVFESSWIRALFVLLGGNFLAFLYVARQSAAPRRLATPPTDPELRAELSAQTPERAVEALRDTFRAYLGAPESEEVRGSRVTMLFSTNAGGRYTGMFAHLGLVMMIAGAGLASRPPPASKTAVRALLEVKDTSSGFVGSFDMVAGEPFQFFRWPAKYTIRNYSPSRDGLGPAVQLERVETEDRSRTETFWVFLNAPGGFDERHRRGEVAIVARSMGLVALPGFGVTSSPAAALLVFGFGLLLAGAAGARRPEGWFWVVADGDRVTVTGLAADPEDGGFERIFGRYVALAGASIAEE